MEKITPESSSSSNEDRAYRSQKPRNAPQSAKPLQYDRNQKRFTDTELWRMRWFIIWLYAITLLASILASVIIALITKNPLPFLVPTPLLLAMRPILRFLFPADGTTNKKEDEDT